MKFQEDQGQGGGSSSSAEWALDPDELRSLFNAKTKAIIFNNPNNPVGKVSLILLHELEPRAYILPLDYRLTERLGCGAIAMESCSNAEEHSRGVPILGCAK